MIVIGGRKYITDSIWNFIEFSQFLVFAIYVYMRIQADFSEKEDMKEDFVKIIV